MDNPGESVGKFAEVIGGAKGRDATQGIHKAIASNEVNSSFAQVPSFSLSLGGFILRRGSAFERTRILTQNSRVLFARKSASASLPREFHRHDGR